MFYFKKSKILFFILFLIITFIFGLYYSSLCAENWNVKLKKIYYNKSNEKLFYPEIDRFSPFIFIGGWPRSGTTLMRIILDVNEQVRCGPETRIIPRILDYHNQISNQKTFLKRTAIDLTTLEAATTAYILEVIRRNGPNAKRLCNKDPMAFIYLSILGKLFPNGKFVLMVRDGRAVTHSIFKRGIKISNINHNDPWDILKHWNAGNKAMYDDCIQLGFSRCMIIKYENLVLRPTFWIKFVSDFLNISLDRKMFSHWKYIKSENIILNIFERSTDQVINPISANSLYDWMNDKVLSNEFITTAHLKAPMLKILSYDITKLPPDYGLSENYTSL